MQQDFIYVAHRFKRILCFERSLGLHCDCLPKVSVALLFQCGYRAITNVKKYILLEGQKKKLETHSDIASHLSHCPSTIVICKLGTCMQPNFVKHFQILVFQVGIFLPYTLPYLYSIVKDTYGQRCDMLTEHTGVIAMFQLSR